MEKERSLLQFNDILEPRRREISNLLWVSRELNTKLAYKQNVKPNPKSHKKAVLTSAKIQETILKISNETGVPVSEVEHQVRLILDEIGFNKNLKIIRWLGLVLTKFCQKVYSGIHVNEDNVNRLKSCMGKCPVIFAPSHRSYADFILMSYICFTYDFEIPSIAAGMDFHAMWGMGAMLRDTGAFFMRRSYNDDQLYWKTFKQYVHQLVTKGDLPIEFFIEGTRSRSCKSLFPKFGLLSMILKPLFTAEVPDILIVPINISYERVLEEKLFAYELLGIPKPKESTSGFFKSLSIIKERYGNIYVDFAEPISAKNYFGDQLNRHKYTMKPIHQQELDQNDRQLINSIAHDIVYMQQKNAVITTFNLIAVLLSNNKMLRKDPFTLESLSTELKWFKSVMETLGALVANERESLQEILSVHKNLIKIDSDFVSLVHNPVVIDNIDPKKLKGHNLSDVTMTYVVPLMMLQLYVNPVLHYLVNCAFISLVMSSFGRNREVDKDELFGHFRFLRSLFSYEFVFYEKRENMEFEEALKHMEYLHVIDVTINGKIILHNHEKLQILFSNMLIPFISAYQCTCQVLQKVPVEMIEHSNILVEVQKELEISLGQNDILHPFCLSLDTLSICLENFTSVGVLEKYRMDGTIKYKITTDKLNFVSEKLEQYSSKCYRGFVKTATNLVHFQAKL